MAKMRVQRNDEGWWIIDVPSYYVEGTPYTSCGPYATKAAAVDDKQGLAKFYLSHPEYALPSAAEGAALRPERKYADHWFVKSLAYKPPRLHPPKHIKSSPGQMLLPGFA